ncbi:MAG: DUF4190 domain-containing protein [Archangium sp.]
MRAFCPNCGTPNEGMPGGRVTCQACTASFELPREDFGAPPPEVIPPSPVVSAPPPASAPGPFIPSELRSTNAPPVMPQGYVGPPPSGFGTGLGTSSAGATNPLAIASLVLGILCCGPIALICGIVAYGQIQQSNGAQKGKELAIAGMVLGSMGLLLALCSVLGRAVH